jgi:hypothetical protein
MVADYFDETDFRELAHDKTSPFKYETTDIDRAQEEVIQRLEKWARTSWKSRTRVDARRENVPLLLTTRIPILTLDSVSIDGTDLDIGGLELNFESGRIRWGDWSLAGQPRLDAPGLIVITYTYGFDQDDVDWAIRRPCIQAARSLLDGEEERGKIPRNTQRYSSERTDLTLGRRGAGKPFPWDSGASDDIRAYWDPSRPRRFISTG